MALRLAEIANMDERGQAHALSALATEPSPAEDRIRRYELRYEMSSAEMCRNLASGQMKETADIAAWLFWLSAQPDHVAG